jgi:hypothetical protein
MGLSRPALTLACALLAGCGGGAPLLHPAHPLPPGEISVGAGLSGQLALLPLTAPAGTTLNQSSLQILTVGPGVAPWAAGRIGFEGSNEAGLTYSGRTLRLDGRHAFLFGKGGNLAISVGLGASALMAERPSSDQASGVAGSGGVFGGGADLPVLLGFRSTGDLYAIWFGPRGGFELLSGRTQFADSTGMPELYDVSGKHFYAGLTLGARVGFRHVHLALEVNAAYHHADGSFQTSASGSTPAGPSTSSSVQQLSITPAGALVVNF